MSEAPWVSSGLGCRWQEDRRGYSLQMLAWPPPPLKLVVLGAALVSAELSGEAQGHHVKPGRLEVLVWDLLGE